MHRRVLLVAHWFPPAGGGGVQRTLGFVRSLPDHGFEPTVLAGAAEGYWAYDPSLLEDVSARVERVALPTWDVPRRWARRALVPPLRRVFDRALIPDERAAWLEPAVRAAFRLHAETPFDVLYTTGPPWTDHLVGALFAGRTGVPWVADFRDPWTQNPHAPPPAALRPVHHRLEAQVHRRAALSISSTETFRRRMQVAFELDPDQTMHLPNGYTESDFADLPSASTELRIGYAGSFYGRHGPERFFQLLERAVTVQPGLQPVVDLYGNTGTPSDRAFDIRVHGYVSQRASLEGLARCRVVFVTVPELPGAEGWVPQKLYVYLRLGRPILWCGPEGDATAILRRAGGAHFVLNPSQPDVPGLARWLQARAQESAPPRFEREVVAEYDRRALTGRLADRMAALVEASRPDAPAPA